jgi:hypothetical protein
MNADLFFDVTRRPEAWAAALISTATLSLYWYEPQAPYSLSQMMPVVALFLVTAAMLVHCVSKLRKLMAMQNIEKQEEEEQRRLNKVVSAMPYLLLSVHQEDDGGLWAVASVLNSNGSGPTYVSARSINELTAKAKELASSKDLSEIMMVESDAIGRSFFKASDGTWKTYGKQKRTLAMASLREAQKVRAYALST